MIFICLHPTNFVEPRYVKFKISRKVYVGTACESQVCYCFEIVKKCSRHIKMKIPRKI